MSGRSTLASQRDITRRQALRTAGGTALAALAGCAGLDGPIGGEQEQDRTATATPTASDAAAQVGMIYALGGLDDRSFNDAANRGIQRARLDYDISFTNHEPAAVSEFSQIQTRLATATAPAYNLLCCIGFLQQDALAETAPNHPDQRFMIVDGVVDSDNVASYVFKEHEGSFQAGHLAGELTTRAIDLGSGATDPTGTTVGFVGGIDTPLIRKFEAGYRAGVAHASEDLSVTSTYIGSFTDVEAGFEAATEMYDSGADIVYHAAGGAGVGVFQAAQAAGRYAIGVDADQSRSNPRYADVILASMVKRVGVAVYNAVTTVVEDTFSGGETVALGLDANGVDLVYGTSLEPAVPSEVKSALRKSRAAIVDGRLDVPTTVSGGDG